MADAPKKQASPGFASLAKTYLMQKIGQAKGTELPAEYNDLRDVKKILYKITKISPG